MAPIIITLRAGVAFSPEAALSWMRGEADLGRQIQTNSTYRDWIKQLGMYLAWNAYVAGRGPYPGHSMAIHPDLSKHCLGLAADSNEWVSDWFNNFMAERGWIRTAASNPTERHHYEYQIWRDQHLNRPAGAGGFEPIEIEEEEDEDAMRIIYHVNRGYAHILPYGHRKYAETKDGNETVAAILGVPNPVLGVSTPDKVIRVAHDYLWDAEVREADRRLSILPKAPAISYTELAKHLVVLAPGTDGATVDAIKESLAPFFAALANDVPEAVVAKLGALEGAPGGQDFTLPLSALREAILERFDALPAEIIQNIPSMHVTITPQPKETP